MSSFRIEETISNTVRSPRRAPRPLAWVAVLLLVVALPSLASAGEHDPALIHALSFFEGNPPDQLLNQHEPGLEEKLLAIVDDEGVVRLARQRAISSLSRYPESALAMARLREIVMDEQRDVTLRMTAVGALAVGFGKQPGTFDALLAALADEDPGLRARAVGALAHIGGPRANEMLAAHRIIERHVLVRRALRGALEGNMDAPLPREGKVRTLRIEHRNGEDLTPPSPATLGERGER